MTYGDGGGSDDCPQTSEEIEAKRQVRKEAALKREKALAYAFSQQVNFLSHACYFINIFFFV